MTELSEEILNSFYRTGNVLLRSEVICIGQTIDRFLNKEIEIR